MSMTTYLPSPPQRTTQISRECVVVVGIKSTNNHPSAFGEVDFWFSGKGWVPSSMFPPTATLCRCCERPKSTILPPLDAEWGAYHAGGGKRRRQAFLRHVMMKNWPFAGLEIGSTNSAVKNWRDDFSMIRRLKPQWWALLIIITRQSTILTKFEEFRQHCDDDDKDTDNDSFATLNKTSLITSY